MRTGEEYSELSEYGGSYGGGRYGPTTWNRGRSRVPAEAEDALGGSDSPRGYSRGRSGLYYSPPGTSYTIVERPSSGMHHHSSRDYNSHHFSKSPRGTYLGSNPNFDKSLSNNKKRAISPEQVLRLFGAQNQSNSKLNVERSRRSPASSPASTSHQVNYRPPSYGFSLHELVTRTVTMVRDPPEGTHGFGICVKGGKEAGVGVYISRVEEGSVAEKAGLRPGDSILEVNGTPFTAITHDEALKYTYVKMSALKLIDTEAEYESNSELKREDMKVLRVYVEDELKCFQISERELYLCLHSCYYDVDKAKRTVNYYLTFRTRWTNLFTRTNPISEPQNTQLRTSSVWSLPNSTSEGYKIIYLALITPDTSIFNMDDQIKLFFSVSDLYLATYGNSKGFVFVIDFTAYSWKHLAKFKLGTVKKFIQYVQDAFPIRLKQVHLINSWAVVDKLLSIAKLFMSTAFYELIHVHTNLETVYKYIPKSYLPEDYGGSEVNVQVMHEKMMELLKDNSSFYQ